VDFVRPIVCRRRLLSYPITLGAVSGSWNMGFFLPTDRMPASPFGLSDRTRYGARKVLVTSQMSFSTLPHAGIAG